jgi:hypothetical protein
MRDILDNSWHSFNPYTFKYTPGYITGKTGEAFLCRLTREDVAFHKEKRAAFCIQLEKKTGQMISRYFLEIHPQPDEGLPAALTTAPRYVKRFAKKQGISIYICVRIAYIETLEEFAGQGMGTLISTLGDKLIQDWSDHLKAPIISYTNDGSRKRWTSRTHQQLLGYELTGHFFPLPIIKMLNLGQDLLEARTKIIFRKPLGPRILKLFYPSAS